MADYRYDCVHPTDTGELSYIVENMVPMTLDEFRKNVDGHDFAELQKELGYTEGFTIDGDWHVRYCKCRLPNENKTAFILVHSCIEHVFY